MTALSLCWAVPGLAFEDNPNLQRFRETHQADLLRIASDNEALKFHKKHWHQSRSISRHHRKTSPTHPNSSLTHHRLTFVANLTAAQLSANISSAIQEQKFKDIRLIPKQQHASLEWMRTKSIPQTVTRMLEFYEHVTTYLLKNPTPHPTRPKQFDEFASYVDQHYPILTGPEDSWVRMLEQGNLSGISQRFSEYWELEPSQDQATMLQADRPQATRADYEQYYVSTRLWPVFRSHLIALTIQAGAEAMQFAKQSMTQITQVQDADTQGRLCGTWHWTVHNHQNHADHKMTVFFGDPAKSPTKQPQPAEVRIKGETVYLLWEFPKGFQEDSLLFSQDDKRLEGTFQNSLGPHGSITGKRLSSCKS